MTAAQAEAARQVCERLQVELDALIRSLGLASPTIVELSDWLEVTRPICQRVLRGVRHRGDSLRALTFLPGVRGLEQFVEATAQRGCPGALVGAARAAVNRYAQLIDDHGGSQARLLAALPLPDEGSGAGGTGASEDLRLVERRDAFEHFALLTGRTFETQHAVFAYRPQPGNPSSIDVVTIMGMFGIRRRDGGLPICPTNVYTAGRPEEIEQARTCVAGFAEEPVADGLPVALLSRFCSKPLPVIVTRQRSGRIPVLVDPDRESRDPMDVVLGSMARGVPHPARDAPRIQNCYVVSDGPSRHLVIDVHLHRSLAQASIPSAASFYLGGRGCVGAPLPGPEGLSIQGNLPADRWFDRLPDRMRLECLGLGVDGVDLACAPAATELTRHLFACQGWPRGEFVAYRCHVEHPVLGAQYLVSFDFEPPGVEGDA